VNIAWFSYRRHVYSPPQETLRFPCRLSNVSCRYTRILRRRNRHGMPYRVGLPNQIMTEGNNPLISRHIRATSRHLSTTSSCQTRTASHPKHCNHSNPYRGYTMCLPVPRSANTPSGGPLARSRARPQTNDAEKHFVIYPCLLLFCETLLKVEIVCSLNRAISLFPRPRTKRGIF
jgi:hypothetical protein